VSPPSTIPLQLSYPVTPIVGTSYGICRPHRSATSTAIFRAIVTATASGGRFVRPLICPSPHRQQSVIRTELSPALLTNIRSLDLQALFWVGRASTGSIARRVRLSTMPHSRVLRGEDDDDEERRKQGYSQCSPLPLKIHRRLGPHPCVYHVY